MHKNISFCQYILHRLSGKSIICGALKEPVDTFLIVIGKHKSTLMRKKITLKNNWIEKNSNLIASVLTFITILITIYYSNINFTLANRQYQDLLEQRKTDSLRNLLQQKRSEDVHYQDSISIARRDSAQREEWNQQYEINKSQLFAFEKQVDIAKLQYKNQQEAFVAQRKMDKPNITIPFVLIDTLLNGQSASRVHFTNTGRLSTLIKRIIIFGWNIQTNQWTFGDFPDDIESNPNATIFVELKLPSSFILNSGTLYFCRVYYIDYDEKIRHKDIFNRVEISQFPRYSVNTVPNEFKQIFISFLKTKIKNYEHVIADNDRQIALEFIK